MTQQDELIEKLTEIVASALSDNDIRPRVKEIINEVLIPAGLVFVDADQESPNSISNLEDWTPEDVQSETKDRMRKAGFKKVTELRKVE